MTNVELKVTLVGNGTITFNDYSSGVPYYILTGTAELLTSLGTRQTKTPKQSGHGVDDSLSLDDDRALPFQGEVWGVSQADRKTKQDALSKCVALPTIQNYASADGYVLVQITDEDGSLKQCYAKIVTYPTFHVLDTSDPRRRGYQFEMMAADPLLYGQTLKSQSGSETVVGDNTRFIVGVSPTLPFQLYQYTAPSITCQNDGIVDAPPFITVYGPCANPKIVNQTSGKYMYLTKAGGLTLAAGERVEIDFNARSITKIDAVGVQTNVSGNLSDDSDWVLVATGSNNIALLDDSSDVISSTITVQWRDCWK